jgi:hypothetical protein
MATPENTVIYECSTNLLVDGDPTNWVSMGYDEGWANNTYDRSNKYRLPYPIDKAYYTDGELNVSKLKEGFSPCVMGRVIALNGHPIWSVVVFLDYAKDTRGRRVSLYRLFFCEGNNLRIILDRVYTYEQVNGRLPFFDPFMTNGFLNDYQDSNIDLDGLIKQEDAVLATSELNRRLLVLPNGTFDVDGGLNALSLIKLHLLTKQRAIAQAKNADPNVKIDKITKIAWAYNADEVLQKAESYGLIQAYDDDAYQVLSKKVTYSPKNAAPAPSQSKSNKNKVIRDSFIEIINSQNNDTDIFKSSIGNLFINRLNGVSKEDFVEIAKQQGLNYFAVQKANDIQAIKLYILISWLFPDNILEQIKYINKFRAKGWQTEIDQFIMECQSAVFANSNIDFGMEMSEAVIDIGLEKIFTATNDKRDEAIASVVKLWSECLLVNQFLVQDFNRFLREQILLVNANKPNEVSTHLQFLNGLYNNDLRGKTKSLRDILNRYPLATKLYQFEWKLWEIEKIKSRKRGYSDFYEAITQNCLTRGSARCQSLVMLLDILRKTEPSLEGAYNFFASISDNGQFKILEYQPDPKKDISEWVKDRTDLLAFAQKNKEESSRNYNYARIYNIVSWVFKPIPLPIKNFLIAGWELLQIIVRGLKYLFVEPPIGGGGSNDPLVSPTRQSNERSDRILLNFFKILLAVYVIAGIILGWGFTKVKAIDKVVEKLPEIDQNFTKVLNSESDKFFKRYQPKPDRCDIILANSELTYLGCNTNFTEKGDDSTKIKIASALVDQGFVSWGIDLFGDRRFKIDYNITTETVTNPFKKIYLETPYPSLMDKLTKNDYFNSKSSEPETELSIAYFEDLNQGKYKYYGLVSGDRISKHIYTILNVEDKKYRNKRELVNAIYRYQVKDINLFIDGKIPKGAVFEKNPTNPKVTIKTPADETYESIKLKLRRKLNQDLKDKVNYSDEKLRKEFEALKKKAEDAFTTNANPKQGDDPTRDTTKSALDKMVDILKNECKESNQGQTLLLSKIEEGIVAELTSASPKKDNNSIDLRKAMNRDVSLVIGDSTDRTRLIGAIFDYQVGSVRTIKVNGQGLPIPIYVQSGEDKEVLLGWDGIINLNGGVFIKVMENVSKQLGCERKKPIEQPIDLPLMSPPMKKLPIEPIWYLRKL